MKGDERVIKKLDELLNDELTAITGCRPVNSNWKGPK